MQGGVKVISLISSSMHLYSSCLSYFNILGIGWPSGSSTPCVSLKNFLVAIWIRRFRLMVITDFEPVATDAVPIEYWCVVWLCSSSVLSKSFNELRRRQQLERLSGLLEM